MASRIQFAPFGRAIEDGFDVASRPSADSPTDSILRAYNEFGVDEEGLSTTISVVSMAEKATDSSRNRAIAVTPCNNHGEAPVGMDAGGLPSHQARALLQRSNKPWLNRAEGRKSRPSSPASRQRAHSTSQGQRYQIGQPELARMIGPYPDFTPGYNVGRQPVSARSDSNLRYASSAASNSSYQPHFTLSTFVRHPAHRRGPSPAMTEPEPHGQDGPFVSRTPSAASTNIVHSRERHHKAYHSRPRGQALGLPRSPLPSQRHAVSSPQHRFDAPGKVKQQVCRDATPSVVSLTPSVNQDAKFWDYSEGYMDVVGLYTSTSSDEQSRNSTMTTPTKAEAGNVLYNVIDKSPVQVPQPLQTFKENKQKTFQSPKPMPSPRTMQKRLSAWNRSQNLQNCLNETKAGETIEDSFKAEREESVSPQNDCDELGIAYELRTNFQKVQDRLARELAKRNDTGTAEGFANHREKNPGFEQDLGESGTTQERSLQPVPDESNGKSHMQHMAGAQILANQSMEVHGNVGILWKPVLQSDTLTHNERQGEIPRLSDADSESNSNSLGSSEAFETRHGTHLRSPAVVEEISTDNAKQVPCRMVHEEIETRIPEGNVAIKRKRQLREGYNLSRRQTQNADTRTNRSERALWVARKVDHEFPSQELGNEPGAKSVPAFRDDGGGRPDSDTLPTRAQPAPPPSYPPPPPPTLGFSSPDIYSRALGFPLRTSSKKAPELSDVTEESTIASRYHSSRSDINNMVHSPCRGQLSNHKNRYLHNLGAQLEIPENERGSKSCKTPSENDSDASVDRMELGFRNAFPTVDDAYNWTESSDGRKGGTETNSSTGMQETSRDETEVFVIGNYDGAHEASLTNIREYIPRPSHTGFPNTSAIKASHHPSRVEVTGPLDGGKHAEKDEVKIGDKVKPCGLEMVAKSSMDQVHGEMPEIRIIPPSTTERSSGYSLKSRDESNEIVEPHRGLRQRISHGLIGKTLRRSQGHLRAKFRSSNEEVHDNDDVHTAVDRIVNQRSQPSIMRRFKNWMDRTADRIKSHRRASYSRMLHKRSFRDGTKF